MCMFHGTTSPLISVVEHAALSSDVLRACAKVHSDGDSEGGGQRIYGAFAHSESTVPA